MKKLLLLVFTFAFFSSNGQRYLGSESGISESASLSRSAGCSPPSTSTYMDINNVSCLTHTAGNMWQIPGQNFSHYEVPKNSNIMALFTSALWLGGTDVNNQLKLAALRYRSGQDYWTGPLTEGDANIDFETCEAYDQHFVTTKDEVAEFDAWFNAGIYDSENGTTTQSDDFPNYTIPNSILNWPAHGDVSLGQNYYLAPFYDRDENGTYEPENGDYPWYDLNFDKQCGVDRRVSLYGDKNFWWVMNDKGNIHTETQGDPIGMEIHAQAFAFSSNDEINNMTFYNYELINRGTQTLFNTFFGFFTDGALGDPFDDYVGCDVNRGLGYYYNGDNFDGDNGGFFGYGENPPAVGVDFFEGPYQDNDGIDNAYGIGPGEALNGIGYGDSIIDNERFGMRRFVYYSNTGQGNNGATDPIDAVEYYNYLSGYWKDGSRFFYGGSGHISDASTNTSVPCDFLFPGDSDPLGWGTGGIPQEPWTEQTANNPPYDRRFLQSAGPFVLKPGAVNNITVGIVWARATGGDPFASVEAVRRADDKAQALFENCFRLLEGPHAPDVSFQELENQVILTLSNPVNSNNANEDYVEFDPFIVAPGSVDKNYRFQGYQIFQLKSEDVSLSDIENPQLARLVAQCDIKDDVSRIINYEFEPSLGASIPVEKVDGENKGISHSFSFTEDAFAQGDRKLVNFKRYYYVAISYAFNEYAPYSLDPNGINGQQKPYLSSRKAATGKVQVIEVIPHNPSPENDGTIQNVAYGSTPRITRIDGTGNGNRALELTTESRNAILQNGKLDRVTYDYGKGPINVKVIDPLNVADGYFICKFNDYSPTNSNGADTASWTIYRYASEGSTAILDSVQSDRTIAIGNEQLIPEWGVSVMIEQQKYYLPEGLSGGTNARVTDIISSSITYADSSKPWLSGIADSDAFFPTNWIRSGDYNPNEPEPCIPDPGQNQDPCSYPDEIGVDPDKKWDGILGGTIAPHRLVGYQTPYMPIAYYNYGAVASARQASSLSFLPSVDIVFTQDKSKWTRVPVIELGWFPDLNVGGAQQGALRKSASVDKNGNPDGTGEGMGWFPGYAIDLETGTRLYMAFGENSALASDNGADMLWNPTNTFSDAVGKPVFGGQHSILIWSTDNKTINGYPISYNFPAYIPWEAENIASHALYQMFQEVLTNNNTTKRNLYGSISWVANPILANGQELLSTDATIRLRVNKEYKNYEVTNENNGRPMYSWSMDDLATETENDSELASVLDIINVVPNPYKAYSQYERNRLDTRVKITNLPERCTIKIFSSNGKLIKTFKKDSPQTFIDWLLVNHKNIPVASGCYLIHVDVPGIGERVLKSFVTMREVDLHGT